MCLGVYALFSVFRVSWINCSSLARCLGSIWRGLLTCFTFHRPDCRICLMGECRPSQFLEMCWGEVFARVDMSLSSSSSLSSLSSTLMYLKVNVDLIICVICLSMFFFFLYVSEVSVLLSVFSLYEGDVPYAQVGVVVFVEQGPANVFSEYAPV